MVDESLKNLYKDIINQLVKEINTKQLSGFNEIKIVLRSRHNIEKFFSKNVSNIKDDLNTLLESKHIHIKSVFNPINGELAYWNCCMTPMINKSIIYFIFCPFYFIPLMLFQMVFGTKITLYLSIEC